MRDTFEGVLHRLFEGFLEGFKKILQGCNDDGNDNDGDDDDDDDDDEDDDDDDDADDAGGDDDDCKDSSRIRFRSYGFLAIL